MAMSRHMKPVLAAAAAALVAAGLGALATNLGPWYVNLEKPAWQPPDWLFGPAWTLIYSLTAASAVLMWWAETNRPRRTRAVGLFVINIALNILWSALFFRLQRPDWALAEVVLLWVSILALIVVLAPVSRQASWLLVPYLVWVSFAGWLNLAVVQLNAPFGTAT